ncbi:hypothetical protein [Comamonas flocculans]|uniref:hypothetical protein n=1 Tax=Comamonas flocculans TaxID=2597701 RepID=UPI00164532C0|nr:hypothetical protein [Comamonas flocculans]
MADRFGKRLVCLGLRYARSPAMANADSDFHLAIAPKNAGRSHAKKPPEGGFD